MILQDDSTILHGQVARTAEAARSCKDVHMDWVGLGKAVVARRVQMGHLSREAFARHSGVSVRLLSDLERGKRTSYDAATLARLEQALEWPPGAAQAILAGDSPPRLRDPRLAGLSLDPRSLERPGDDIELLAIIAEADLSPGDALEAAVWVRARRAKQHQELVKELRMRLASPGQIPIEDVPHPRTDTIPDDALPKGRKGRG